MPQGKLVGKYCGMSDAWVQGSIHDRERNRTLVDFTYLGGGKQPTYIGVIPKHP